MNVSLTIRASVTIRVTAGVTIQATAGVAVVICVADRAGRTGVDAES